MQRGNPVGTTTLAPESSHFTTFYSSVLGQQIAMAVTGFILFAFVLFHMLANLLVYLPLDADGVRPLDAYATRLHALPALLWTARAVLLFSVILHIVTAWQLTALNKFEARKVRYVKWTPIASTYASRTMVWSGPIIFVFVIYHLLDLTFGVANPDYEPGHVYHNVIASFSHPVVAIFYIVANVSLAVHLYHGVWSMCQTVGLAHPRYTPILKKASVAFALVIGVGFCSIPLSVMFGLVH